MLYAQLVVTVVDEGDVEASPVLAEAHAIVGQAPFLAEQESGPISLYLSHLKARADAGQFEAEEPNHTRCIKGVSGWKTIH